MAFPETIQTSAAPSTPPHGLENNQNQASQRSNHVSSVLLYGIPIVSLYIEGQERLCLAQISNTLLKQFSYNEIHNRRVALGITCVQCTPVQLEILRRAGAMPVSSRRCGMITRREAERLCKSFLGDNSPPRLPDDFAFSVQHKCAWGCRGSFLPSRYNSSRAKCIKCSYCGMFFSPNKFIFHSHRITTNDRYVQPDAANFNSWRRHMTLNGNAQDEKIIHAWEDVKAMFNGGTRKRLVSSSSRNTTHNTSSPTSSTSGMVTMGTESSCSSPVNCESDGKLKSICEDRSVSLDQQYNYSTVAAAATVVGVTAVAAATVGVPFNLHRSSVLSPLQSLRNEHDLSIMPLSRNFVVDYMWQQQQQHQKHSKKTCGEASALGFDGCPMSWVRSEANGPRTPTPTATTTQHQNQSSPVVNIKSEPHLGMYSKGRKFPDSTKSSELSLSDYNIPSILSCSAFKPVVASAAIVSTSLYTRSCDSSSNTNVYITPGQATRTTGVLTHNSITTASHHLPLPLGTVAATGTETAFTQILDTLPSGTESEQLDFPSLESVSTHVRKNSDRSISTEMGQDNANSFDTDRSSDAETKAVNDDDDEDDEMVDIETTEDEAQVANLKEQLPTCLIRSSHSISPAHLQSSANSDADADVDVDVDVDGLTTDAEDQFDLTTNICSYDNNSRSSTQFYNDKMTGSLMSTQNEMGQDESKGKEEAADESGQLKNMARRKGLGQKERERKISKKAASKFMNEKLVSKSLSIKAAQPGLHIQQSVTFPVFLKTQVNSLRHQHARQATLSQSTLADSSNKWSYPLGSIRQFYCYEATSKANENCIDFKQT
ncbi:uncharacterized protein LOC6651335 [Drosophila willistoni]|uniref:uncharacterized protein LOC6651335 n=1 Tax=Drosophila willistoni TaxID=7260 RepID=UPI000C26C511|nr:uncharacterized protein LOC6651335 [Drosophila willistoni]XP_046869511.1 uncharacterized protein LOC6651335 [Drosophila willistoni]